MCTHADLCKNARLHSSASSFTVLFSIAGIDLNEETELDGNSVWLISIHLILLPTKEIQHVKNESKGKYQSFSFRLV